MLQCLDYCARSRRFNVPGRSCGYATQRPYPVLVLHVWVRCCVNPYNRRALSCYDQVQSTIALLCVVDTCLLEECMAACIALERSESFNLKHAASSTNMRQFCLRTRSNPAAQLL